MAVLGRQGVAEGQMVRHGVMPITGVRGWGDRMEVHMDHAWLMMRSHAHGETRVHLGELGPVEVVGDDDARRGPGLENVLRDYGKTIGVGHVARGAGGGLRPTIVGCK